MTIKFFGESKLSKEQVAISRMALVRDTIYELEQLPNRESLIDAIRLLQQILANYEREYIDLPSQPRT